MLSDLQQLFATLLAASTTIAAPLSSLSSRDNNNHHNSSTGQPFVVLKDYHTFIGNDTDGVTSFNGIRYAQPPVDDLRLRRALPPLRKWTKDLTPALSFSPSCPQISILPPSAASEFPPEIGDELREAAKMLQAEEDVGEDCLAVNVWGPSGVGKRDKLPVMVFIHGGAFVVDSSRSYSGEDIVRYSKEINKPIIFVSLNYRMGAFGFLGGREVQEAGLGNLGLTDQRLALKFIQKHIASFGGDPKKVTVWGQSAGAISLANQLVLNDGHNEGLFKGAILTSGSLMNNNYINSTKPQETFDAIVAGVNCSSPPEGTSKLDCLRLAPVEAIGAAAAPLVFNFLNGPWVEGETIKEPGPELLKKGKYAKVPLISSTCDDEGTLFSFIASPANTTEEMLAKFKASRWNGLTPEEGAELARLYPDDPAAGSPFNTGSENNLWPQYKRSAAIEGDASFVAPRRQLLHYTSSTQPTWTYTYKRGKRFPVLGSLHGIDILTEFFAPGIASSDKINLRYLLSFVDSQDPNNWEGAPVRWGRYRENEGRKSISFEDEGRVVDSPYEERREGTELIRRLGNKYTV